MSRTVAKDRAVAHEFMQIRSGADGLVFVARPSGQAEATFRLVKSGARDLVFEKSDPRFPATHHLPAALSRRARGTHRGHGAGPHARYRLPDAPRRMSLTRVTTPRSGEAL